MPRDILACCEYHATGGDPANSCGGDDDSSLTHDPFEYAVEQLHEAADDMVSYLLHYPLHTTTEYEERLEALSNASAALDALNVARRVARRS